ncbi:uncharacterized protein LOC124156356 [Ischnura elegans]|uniref:uncharacterized protein LOC124156356 n=1 Tax=Ischnura elegans TaxID=197161 RepID=UPI001ED8B072|nr:uncharacterized protein LOC124156356 [Ischnura elegans]
MHKYFSICHSPPLPPTDRPSSAAHKKGPPLAILVGLLMLWNPAMATLDLTLTNLQMVADRMPEDECRRLVAALHINTFEYPGDGAVDARERLLEGEEEAPCLDRLLRWNSSGGRGETHDALARRLRQMGHGDLADRLSADVHEALADALRTANQEEPPPPALPAAPKEEEEGMGGDPFSRERKEAEAEENSWGPGDSLLLMGAAVLSAAAAVLGIAALSRRCSGQWWPRPQGEDGGGEAAAQQPLLTPPPSSPR